MNMQKRKSNRNNQALFWLVGLLTVSAIIIAFILFQDQQKKKREAYNAAIAQMGAVTDCQSSPQFSAELSKDGTQLMGGTNAKGYVGYVMINATTGQVVQHPSWTKAGYLGAFTYDKLGTVYLAPAPLASLELNPVEKQNILWSIDTKSAEMTPFIDLPPAKAFNENNPYGLVNFAYDCDTNLLYAASIASSSPTEEVGRIFRIDLSTKKVIDQLEGIEALSMGIYQGINDKRLYYGSARTGVVSSVKLEADGSFGNDTREEFSLSALANTTKRPRRLIFRTPDQLEVRAFPFNYSLNVTSENQDTYYYFSYSPETDKWTLYNTKEPEQ